MALSPVGLDAEVFAQPVNDVEMLEHDREVVEEEKLLLDTYCPSRISTVRVGVKV